MKYPLVVLIVALLAIAVSCDVFADLWIGFWSDRGPGSSSFYIMTPEGSEPINLTAAAGLNNLITTFGEASPPQVKWSPDRTKILFDSKRTGNFEIFITDADGSNLVNLTNNPALDRRPRWSPDGTMILWSRSPHDGFGGNREIFVMNAGGSDKRNLGNGYWPRWSPDGRMIGFTLWPHALIMNADGSGRRRVTDRLGETRFISWSRDGKRIALGLHTPFGFKHEHIYVVNLDGTGLVELTKDLPNFNCYGGAWSPDSKKIAFYRLEGHTRPQIYVVNADGTNPVRLTGPPATNRKPSWSPDGSKIVFESRLDGVEDIYIMNADGFNQINLTNHPSRDRSPSWFRFDLAATSVSPQEKLITIWGKMKHGNP